MFGTNKVAHKFNDTGEHLKVVDGGVFYTIQGEGPDAGRPAVFVRLAHCNLRCYFCDTAFDHGEQRGIYELMQFVKQQSHRARLVVITGGEPLLQNIVPFVKLLNESGYAVSVETAGTVFYPELRDVFSPTPDWTMHDNKIVCSPKTPAINRELVPLISAFKYIIRDGESSVATGLPNMSTQNRNAKQPIYDDPATQPNAVPIYVQPLDEGEPEANQKNLVYTAMIALAHGYRLSVQLHKLAGLD